MLCVTHFDNNIIYEIVMRYTKMPTEFFFLLPPFFLGISVAFEMVTLTRNKILIHVDQIFCLSERTFALVDVFCSLWRACNALNIRHNSVQRPHIEMIFFYRKTQNLSH